jgi:arylsulfatase A-like enzyme
MPDKPLSRTAGPLALALALLGLSPAADADARKPNVLMIVADDLGYADLGCQGGRDVVTPQIDSLARDGVRCTNAYVTCPVCSPTRAGLITGRYQQRFGHEFNPGNGANTAPNFGLPLSETTLADRLKAEGYRTGIVGKWHLGFKPEFHPLRRGFDEFFGFLGGSHPYLPTEPGLAEPILRGTEPVAEPAYLTEALTREATAFIDRNRGGPFFLYLTYNAVHAPMQVTQSYADRFKSTSDEVRRTHLAMLSALDDGVGAVLDRLRQHGLDEDTLVLFISDNGGPTRVTTSRNDPLSGLKGQVREGGIRVPLLARWKGRLPAGKVYDPPVISLDIVPTSLAASGATLSSGAKVDGTNLLPYLSGERTDPPHGALFWRYGVQSAVREGDWKLVRIGSDPPQLFNLRNDVGEQHDLSRSNPEKAKSLDDALRAWASQLAAPLWPNRRANDLNNQD